MFLRLLFLFTVVPLIELFILVRLGSTVGFLPTLALVLLTGALGAWLARQQGLRTLGRLREDLAAGRMPTEALVEGVLILLAGAVLLTPGLLTDLAGFALLAPPLRRQIRRLLGHRFGGRLSGNASWTGTVVMAGATRDKAPQADDQAPRVLIIEPDDDSDP